MRTVTTQETIITTFTIVLIGFLLEKPDGVDPGEPLGKCNPLFPWKKEEPGNFLRLSGTVPEIKGSLAVFNDDL